MPNELRWVEADEVERLNRLIVAMTDEPFQLRDRLLLESACDRPCNLWRYTDEDDVLVLAVALIAGIGHNHPFVQGNKRTAFEAGVLFLRKNGWRLVAPDTAALPEAIISLIEHRIDEADLANHLHPHLVEDD